MAASAASDVTVRWEDSGVSPALDDERAFSELPPDCSAWVSISDR
jgi:hypothetical protein